MKKFFNTAAFPEYQSFKRGIATDEASQRDQEDMDEVTTKYFRSKWDFYLREKLKQLKITTKDIAEGQSYYGQNGEGKDEMVKNRAEFMYSYMDYDNDRERVRTRFLKNDPNQKTNLKDIGKMLDKFLLDERAEGARFLDVVENPNEL